MSKTFSSEEKYILSLFNKGEEFIYQNQNYIVNFSGKPICPKGEPKTDIYVNAFDDNKNEFEFKISFKQQNADFLENKINAERAQQLFGDDWQNIIYQSTNNIRNKFEQRLLIYKDSFNRTSAGSITLGWKFELLNKESGTLSSKMSLTPEQILDVYAGTNLSDEKKNAMVNNTVINNSGIANFILVENHKITNIQDAIDSLVSIEDYTKVHPEIYFACKALNYRTFENKYDGNRPLAVFVDWDIIDEKLTPYINFDYPLLVKGDDSFNNLMHCLEYLNVETTDDLNKSNVGNSEILYSDHLDDDDEIKVQKNAGRTR